MGPAKQLSRPAHQRGVFLLVLSVIMASIVGSIALANLNAVQFGIAERDRLTARRLEKIRLAVVAYVAANGMAPCGVIGSNPDDGIGAALVTCGLTRQHGVVPWATLNLAQADSFDGWGRKISYRIYTGATGLTGAPVAEGRFADMTHCDTSGPFLSTLVGANALCQSALTPDADHNSATDYLAVATRPGFTVIDHGTTVTQVGLVLISHGNTGYGAYMGNTQRMTMPDVGNTAETNNANNAGPFYVNAFSASDVSATAVAHFDDRVAYMRIRDLIVAAGRGPRDWHN